jgi:hypothetical protein
MARSGGGKVKGRAAKAAGNAATDVVARVRELETELEEARARIRRLEEERDQVRNRIDWVIDSLHNVIGE